MAEEGDPSRAVFQWSEDVEVECIPELELEDLPDNPFIVFVGSRRAGKTHLAKWIYSQMHERFDDVFVLTKTGASGTWDEVAQRKERLVRDHFPEMLRLIIECQELVRESKGRDRMPRLCIILDDVLGHIPHGDESLEDLATQGRWLNCTVMLLEQYYKGFSPMIRGNTDLMLAFSNLPQGTGESLFEETSYSAAITRQEFREMYRDIAQGYTALAILRTAKAQDVKERFFHITAPEKLPELNGGPKRKPAARKRHSNECVVL